MMEGFFNLVNSKSASHAMRLYARKCLDYHQAYERRFKIAWLDLVDAGMWNMIQVAVIEPLTHANIIQKSQLPHYSPPHLLFWPLLGQTDNSRLSLISSICGNAIWIPMLLMRFC